MGKLYRHGKLISQETLSLIGQRTLAGATAEELWSGAAVDRPTPAGIQLSAVSSSVQDDAAVADKWTCTLGGSVDTGDIARLTLDGVNYDTECSPALNTLALRCAEIATSAMSGTWDTWKLTITGGNAAGTETITVQIPGDTGGDAGSDTWTYHPAVGRTNAEMAGDLRTALATSTMYDISGASTFVSIKKKARGAGVTIVTTADGALSTGQAHTVTGVAGQTAWTVTNDGVSAVTCERAVAGPTAGTVASSYSTDAGAASTFVAVHTLTGAAGTGIRTLRIDYLDANGAAQYEVVSMNGTTAVLTTATDCGAILAVTAGTVGSNGGAVGTVSIKDAGGVTTYEQIDAGYCQATAAVVVVPGGRSLYLGDVHVTVSASSQVLVCSDASPVTGLKVAGSRFVWATFHAGAQANELDIGDGDGLGPFPTGSRVWMEVIGAVGRIALAQMDCYLVTNN